MIEDSPDSPLNLNKLVTLPPSEWRVYPCDDGRVIIGAWTDPFQNRIYKRVFRFTERPE
jgi:hypothetical protein